MTHQAPPAPAPAGADPGRQVAQLREALRLIDRIAELPSQTEASLDEAARVSSAYDRALPIVQRRFDALAGETAVWVSAGIEALVAAGDSAPRAAAVRLSQSIHASLRELADLLE